MKTNLTMNRMNLAALFGGALILTSLTTVAFAAQRPISDFVSRQGQDVKFVSFEVRAIPVRCARCQSCGQQRIRTLQSERFPGVNG